MDKNAKSPADNADSLTTNRKGLMKSSWTIWMGASLGCALLLVGCSSEQDEPSNKPVDRAVAVVHPTEGNKASGTVTFNKTAMGSASSPTSTAYPQEAWLPCP